MLTFCKKCNKAEFDIDRIVCNSIPKACDDLHSLSDDDPHMIKALDWWNIWCKNFVDIANFQWAEKWDSP